MPPKVVQKTAEQVDKANREELLKLALNGDKNAKKTIEKLADDGDKEAIAALEKITNAEKNNSNNNNDNNPFGKEHFGPHIFDEARQEQQVEGES